MGFAIDLESVTTFQAPKPDQVANHLQNHVPTGPSRLAAWLPIAALVAAVLVTMTVQEGPAQMLPWIILLAVFAMTGHRVRTVRHLESQVGRIQELAMLRHYPGAARLAWRLIPKLVTMPALHGRTVAFMAHVFDQVRAYDAAIVAYDYVLEHLPNQHPGAVPIQIHRTIAQLATDQLTAADQTLRRLRNSDATRSHPALAAAMRLAFLFQQVRTNHFAEAAESSTTVLDELRPLGVDAGFGHGLMALACHMQGLQEGQATSAEAATWWSRATLLLEPDVLVERFGELVTVADCYRPHEPRPPATGP